MENKFNQYMSEAINQAKLAMGLTSPNPPVGAVLVSEHNKIIGMGHTQAFGKNHAEVEAINSSYSNVQNSTLYTTLEPCSIEINTPPCTDKIIKSKIKHVIIGTTDPNPKINGKGIKILEENGITTEIFKHNESLEYTLESYKYFVKNKKPFFTVKYAMSLDGKIASDTGDSKWISSKDSREYVHHIRSNSDAILTGVSTIIYDNPQLNVRLSNYLKEYQPKKIILDTNGRVPFDSKTLDSNCILITSKIENKLKNKLCEKGVKIEYIPLGENRKLDLKYLPDILIKYNLINIFVEAGSTLPGELLYNNLVNKIILFISPKIIGKSKFTPFGSKGINKIINSYKPKKIIHSSIEDDVVIKAWL
ncbi:MAG: riboflavin biosynthesis protein RibD [Chloroflexi bacterium]|nr:riboflavin biosynthesis protein RibD [Chloroflexota bacterium]